MPKIITGVAGATAADETPSMQVPVSGDRAAAAALELGQQQHLNATAVNAARINEVTALLQAGVPRVRQVASIAALKALDTGEYGVGSIVFVTGLTTSGSVVKGGGLFVLVAAAVAEMQVPGVPDAYLSVAPNAGGGRWLNVGLSLGWSGGGLEALTRRPHTKLFDVHGPGGSGHVVAVTGGADPVSTPVMIPVSAADGDGWEVEVNATVASAFAGLIEVQLGVIVPPGAGDPVPATGAVAVVQGGVMGGTSVSLRYVTPSSPPGAFLVVLLAKCSTSGNIAIREDWQAVVRLHSSVL